MLPASLSPGLHACAIMPVRGQLRHRGGKPQLWAPVQDCVVLRVWTVGTGISIPGRDCGDGGTPDSSACNKASV